MTSYPRQDPYAVMAREAIEEFSQRFDLILEKFQKTTQSLLKVIDNQAEQLDGLHKELDELTEERRTILRQQSNLNQSE